MVVRGVGVGRAVGAAIALGATDGEGEAAAARDAEDPDGLAGPEQAAKPTITLASRGPDHARSRTAGLATT
jgi:hypothetical protein